VQADDRAGYTALLQTKAHSVSGTATIVDEDTFRVDDFTYDGGGISVFFYLGTEQTDAAFASGLQVGPQLFGTPYNDDSLVLDLPAGHTLDGYNAVSVWCVTAGADFGSGTFVPEPATAGLLATGIVVMAIGRSRRSLRRRR